MRKRKSAGGGYERVGEIVIKLSDYAKWIIGVIEHQGLQKNIVINIHINKSKSQFVRTSPDNPNTKFNNPAGVSSVFVQLKIAITRLERICALETGTSNTQFAHLIKTLSSVIVSQPATAVKHNF